MSRPTAWAGIRAETNPAFTGGAVKSPSIPRSNRGNRIRSRNACQPSETPAPRGSSRPLSADARSADRARQTPADRHRRKRPPRCGLPDVDHQRRPSPRQLSAGHTLPAARPGAGPAPGAGLSDAPGSGQRATQPGRKVWISTDGTPKLLDQPLAQLAQPGKRGGLIPGSDRRADQYQRGRVPQRLGASIRRDCHRGRARPTTPAACTARDHRRLASPPDAAVSPDDRPISGSRLVIC